MTLNQNWSVLQDVHDLGETLKIYREGFEFDRCAHLVSNWEPLDRLTALQVALDDTPYHGRHLRYFNHAPWWYKNSFDAPEFEAGAAAVLRFEAVDYYCKIWLNGRYIGAHEGYFAPFAFEVGEALKPTGNQLLVKVWAPWDTTVLKGAEAQRCYSVKREMVKGTYEHADGFIQRDVNPVGIWGDIALDIFPKAGFYRDWRADVTVAEDLASAAVEVRVPLAGEAEGLMAVCTLADEMGREVCRAEKTLAPGADIATFSLALERPKLWNTWDRGGAYLYTVRVALYDGETLCSVRAKKVGARRVALERTDEVTQFWLNGKKIYLRGTSYFADIYLSEMSRDRYYKDLVLIKEAGFNAVRVHVHVEMDCFYTLCDELGLAVLQDGDFNCDHPTNPAWQDRAVAVYADMVRMLKDHPSILCWVAFNEPDLWKIFAGELMDTTPQAELMLNSLCPRLVAVMQALDPDRPYIKASRENDDPESGDTHTYTGSLATGTEYTGIDGTVEKLNSEFGMDVPGDAKSMYRDKAVYRVLGPIADEFGEMQNYQYRLLRYYIDHYRSMKYAPNAGYFQFMFIDLCPQSFYGILDYYGVPKQGYYAMKECNMPLAVLARKQDDGFRVLVANDYLKAFEGRVEYTVLRAGACVAEGALPVRVDEDSLAEAGQVPFEWRDDAPADIHLRFVGADGEELAANRYKDAFCELPHIEGHSLELDNEMGMRLFMLKARAAAKGEGNRP